MSTLAINVPAAFLDVAKHFLMAMTIVGEAFVWNIITATDAHTPTLLLSLLGPARPFPSSLLGAAPAVLSASVRPNGTSLQCWVHRSVCWKGQ
ncbi:hypothetical protein DFH11DRAFT_496440 [Phellopilus nigrolimitatus]|nr:hypothetical protein DFH11DRAFT_496440 [Phellopilus nigrolimitatus]